MALQKVSSGVAGFLAFEPMSDKEPDGPSLPMAGRLMWRQMRDMDGELEWRAGFETDKGMLVLPSHRALLSTLQRLGDCVEGPTGKTVKLQRTGLQEPKTNAKGKRRAPQAYFLYDVWEATGADEKAVLADEAMNPELFVIPQKG